MRFLRSLFADVGLLSLACVFGWAIWYTVREDLIESQRREVEVTVEAEPGLEVTPRSQAVVVSVQGPRRAVDALRSMKSPRVVRRLTAADLPNGADETRRDLAKEDLDFAIAFGGSALTVVEMEPQVVSVKLFRVEVREKPVAAPELQGAAELGLRHQLQGYTNSAKVRGPASALASIREIRTYVAREQLQGFAESLKDAPKTVARLVLEVDPAQRGLFTLVEPAQLTARVELSRVAEQEIVVPIEIHYTGAARRLLGFAEINKPHFLPGDPPRVRLMVSGVPGALAALETARVRAFALASDLAEGQPNGDVPVHVADLPPGVALARGSSVYVEETR